MIGCHLLWLLGCSKEEQVPKTNDFVSFTGKNTYSIPSIQVDTLCLEFKVSEGFHIMSDEEKFAGITTKIRLNTPEGLSVGSPIFPKPKALQLRGATDTLSVFENHLEVLLPLQVINSGKKGNFILKGSLFYQACDSRKCYFPRELAFSVQLKCFNLSQPGE